MYKKRSEFKKIAAIAVGACGIAYGFGGAEVQAAPPEGGNWTLLPASSDEFDGDGLDENKWTNGIWYDVTTDLAFCPENVSVRDGNLVLTAKKQTITERLIRQERWNQNSMFRELQAM